MKAFLKFEAVSYDHAAALIGVTPWAMSRDVDLMVAGHEAAIDAYQLAEVVMGVDIYNLEAEAYGLEIAEPPGHGMPFPVHPGWDDLSALAGLQLDTGKGRLPMVLEAAAKLAARCLWTRVRIPLAGPFTIASHFLGLENMACELFSEPEETVEAMQAILHNQIRWGREVEARGFGVTLFESSVAPPLLSPELFRKCIAPMLRSFIGAMSQPVQLIVGGNTLPILDELVGTGAGYLICPVETDQGAFLEKLGQRRTPHLRFNLNPAVFLPGQREGALLELERARCLATGYPAASLGSLIPFDADKAIVQEVIRACGC